VRVFVLVCLKYPWRVTRPVKPPFLGLAKPVCQETAGQGF
jgi:hypothetical protein